MKFYYSIHEEEYLSYVGNISASGDDALDKESEDEVERRLNAGDILAWFTVIVEARWWSPANELHQGSANRGGCNYSSNTTLEEIVEDLGLKEEAIDALMSGLEDIVKAGKCIQETLGDAEEKEQCEGTTTGRSDSGHRVMDLLDGDEGCEE